MTYPDTPVSNAVHFLCYAFLQLDLSMMWSFDKETNELIKYAMML